MLGCKSIEQENSSIGEELMDRRERTQGDWDSALLAALQGFQTELWTALPGILLSFDPVAQTCEAQLASMIKISNADGSFRWVDVTPLVDVPVVFPSGGGYTLTFPMTPGDELLLVFSMRCIDSWWEQGRQVADKVGSIPPDLRLHDLSDGFAIPQPRSKPRMLQGFSTTTAQLRSDDGTMYIELAGGHVVNIVAPGGVNIQGNLHVSGAVIAGFGGGDQVGLQTHRHSQGNDSNGDVEVATNAPTAGT